MSSLNSGLPEYEYPVPLVVRNTFLEMKMERSLSLEEFFEERRIHSCPVAPEPTEPVQSTHDDSDARFPQPCPSLDATSGAPAVFWTMPVWEMPAARCEEMLPPGGPLQQPRVLDLSAALSEPAFAFNELPTVGSAGHYTGNCKPCAFYHTRGCGNGEQCPFCHLCGPNEKRRRQKEKIQAVREMRRQRTGSAVF